LSCTVLFAEYLPLLEERVQFVLVTQMIHLLPDQIGGSLPLPNKALLVRAIPERVITPSLVMNLWKPPLLRVRSLKRFQKDQVCICFHYTEEKELALWEVSFPL
jgi:hypothetical protein